MCAQLLLRFMLRYADFRLTQAVSAAAQSTAAQSATVQASEIFGPENQDLHEAFQALLSRHNV